MRSTCTILALLLPGRLAPELWPLRLFMVYIFAILFTQLLAGSSLTWFDSVPKVSPSRALKMCFRR